MFSETDGIGQRNILKVLQAYAVYNPQLGYCQGMGMLVGMLLMRMDAEESFWTLVAILEKYIPNYHSVTLYELRVDAAVFGVCLKKFMKPLATHFVRLFDDS